MQNHKLFRVASRQHTPALMGPGGGQVTQPCPNIMHTTCSHNQKSITHYSTPPAP